MGVVLIWIIFVVINALMLMESFDDYFQFSTLMGEYVVGDTQLGVFVITLLMILVATFPIYQMLNVAVLSSFRGITNRFLLINTFLIIITSILVSGLMTLFIVFIVTSIYEIPEKLLYFVMFNLIYVLSILIFNNNRWIHNFVDLLMYKKVMGADKVVKYLDTSALIDGRVVKLFDFMEGDFIVLPEVITELHKLSDENTDLMKRKKGQNGLKTLTDLKSLNEKRGDFNLIIKNEGDYVKDDVDDIILEDIKNMSYEPENVIVVTNDYNLTLNIKSRGIRVLNVNELTHELKINIDEGDVLEVIINKSGAKRGQGIATLEDGTLVVVDDASQLIGKKVEVEVYNKLSKDSGTMLFCKIKEEKKTE